MTTQLTNKQSKRLTIGIFLLSCAIAAVAGPTLWQFFLPGPTLRLVRVEKNPTFVSYHLELYNQGLSPLSLMGRNLQSLQTTVEYQSGQAGEWIAAPASEPSAGVQELTVRSWQRVDFEEKIYPPYSDKPMRVSLKIHQARKGSTPTAPGEHEVISTPPLAPPASVPGAPKSA